MIVIDDAGTGSIIGVPVVVGVKDGVVKSVPMADLKGSSATEETLALLELFGVTKDEEIRVCQGNVFHGFCREAKRLGYTNVIPMKIEGDFQTEVEAVFMESLYDLGVDRSVVLHEKDYAALHTDIFQQLYRHPELLVHVRPHYQVKSNFTQLVYRIDRLLNEFPNLYRMLLEA